ncbi:hypothetical protein GAGA_3466 [Paraglaciecola agarilytica NO2]|uniref:Uncharacterized protein n=1 Tax=Paraglaciecola agarilytica NO2 TaxID=1125747 RepID=A0ABQ0IAC3_9ALTE|nr:hypothetical protein GAGA_3466 [Paraglaciecola agarilytica NO2]
MTVKSLNNLRIKNFQKCQINQPPAGIKQNTANTRLNFNKGSK